MSSGAETPCPSQHLFIDCTLLEVIWSIAHMAFSVNFPKNI